MKTILLLTALFSFSAFGNPIFQCDDEGVITADDAYDVSLQIYKNDPQSYSASMTFSKHGNLVKTIKQTSLYLWNTYGAEVLIADGKFIEVTELGEREIEGKEFVISRMVTPDGRGMTSINLKFTDSSKNISYISRSCR